MMPTNRGPQGRPDPLSMLADGGGKDGAGDWQDYTLFRQKVFEPVFREIHDRFKYANLEDPDRQQLVAMLADLGDMQLGAAANQFTQRVQALHSERDAIMEVLSRVGMPVARPIFDQHGRLRDRVRNPLYEPVDVANEDDELPGLELPEEPEPSPEPTEPHPDIGVFEDSIEPDDDDEDEDEDMEEVVSEDPLEDEDGEEVEDDQVEVREMREEISRTDPIYRELDHNGEPEYLDQPALSLDAAIDVDREEMDKEGWNGIWYVPLTSAECYDRLEDIIITLRLLFEDRARAMRGGYFYDSGPLLEELQKSPDERSQGDITYMYPFFYRQCFRICSITPEDLHGHIQAVNADQIQERHGGNFLSPKQMQDYIKQQGGNG